MIFNITGNISIRKVLLSGFDKIPFDLTVKSMSHEFKHDVRITVNAGTLPLQGQLLKDFINISHVEVSTEAEIFCPPIVSSQERMHIRNATLTRCTIPKMSHIKLSGKRKVCLCIVYIRQLLRTYICIILMYITKYLCNGIRTLGPFTEHILMSGSRIQLYTSQSCTFLPSIMLFLHHEIEFIEAIHPSAILLLIVFKWLQQAYQRNATIFLYLFHLFDLIILR